MKISLLTIPISDKMVLFSYWIASTMGIIWLDYYKGSLLQRYQTPDLLEKAKLLDCAVFLENAGLEWPKCL